jgi:hypothetical protein
MPIEVIAPLDLSDEQAEAVLQLLARAEKTVQSSTALAILIRVAGNTLTDGRSTMSHAAFGRMTGQCRRSIDGALKRLKSENLIHRVGTTAEGRAIYRANLAARIDHHDME